VLNEIKNIIKNIDDGFGSFLGFYDFLTPKEIGEERFVNKSIELISKKESCVYKILQNIDCQLHNIRGILEKMFILQ